MSTKIPILSVYNENGNRIGIPAIRGKSAYQYAVDGGYTGTEEEFAEKLAFLMGYSVFGCVDENNDVILSGNLADGTYTLKYEMADGTYSEIGNLVVGEIVAEPVNLFVIGGDGYIINGRCSSTGADRSDSNGYIVSNYIEVENGDTVYIKNATVSNSASAYSGMKLTGNNTIGLVPSTSESITNDSEANGITQFTINKADAAYVRICIVISSGTAITNDIVASKNIIITKNEPLS